MIKLTSEVLAKFETTKQDDIKPFGSASYQGYDNYSNRTLSDDFTTVYGFDLSRSLGVSRDYYTYVLRFYWHVPTNEIRFMAGVGEYATVFGVYPKLYDWFTKKCIELGYKPVLITSFVDFMGEYDNKEMEYRVSRYTNSYSHKFKQGLEKLLKNNDSPDALMLDKDYSISVNKWVTKRIKNHKSTLVQLALASKLTDDQDVSLFSHIQNSYSLDMSGRSKLAIDEVLDWTLIKTLLREYNNEKENKKVQSKKPATLIKSTA